MKKIVIIGGESTGKSTLCEQLASHFKTNWTPEFAREYIENLNRIYNQSDLTEIAKGQIILENKMLIDANEFLFCDTDLYVIKVWSEHKYNNCDNQILNLIANQNHDAYILTAPDIPWIDDPLRENPGEKDRKYFFNLYKDIVEAHYKPFCIIEGNEQERLQKAVEFVNQL